MTTILDIAREANVSTATVSRVVNSSGNVSDEKQMLVEAAIKKLNYEPNAIARELVTKSTNIIGLLVPDITNTYVPTVMNSFVNEIESYKYTTFLGITNADPQKELRYINIMLQKRVEALVLLGSRLRNSATDKRLAEISKRIPVLFMDYLPDTDGDFACVMTDEEKGTFLATEYLINLGHKRIAFLNGNTDYTTYFYKHKGFAAAMKKHGIEVQRKYMVTVDPHFNGGYLGCTQLLELSEHPTAILASGDQVAVGTYKAIFSKGLKVPDDISVIGYSGSPMSEGVYPALTTVLQFALEAGSEAAHMLRGLLKGSRTEKEKIFTPRIAERESCHPLTV